MKRARTRLQRRIKPIKGYRVGGAVRPDSPDYDAPGMDISEPEFPDDEKYLPPPEAQDDSGRPFEQNPALQRAPEDTFLRRRQPPQPEPRREVPTMRKGGRVKRYQNAGAVDPFEEDPMGRRPGSAEPLRRMTGIGREFISKGQVPGYGHLRADAERLVEEEGGPNSRYHVDYPYDAVKSGAVNWYELNPDKFAGYRAGGRVSPELQEYHQYLQQGGVIAAAPPEVTDPENRMRYRLNDESVGMPRSPLEIPIGRGELSVRPYIAPGQTMEVEGRYDYPLNDSTSLSAEGYFRQPMYEPNMPSNWGAGVRLKKKFRKGGRVKKFQQGARVPGQNDPDPTNDMMGDASSSNALMRMSPWKRDWIARGEVPGYGHLQADAEQMEPSAFARETPYAKDKAETNAYYDTKVGADSFPMYRRGGRVKKFQSGGVQTADAGDIRTGRELGFDRPDMPIKSDDEYESLGYSDEMTREQSGRRPELMIGDPKSSRPGQPQFWKRREKERPMSAIDTRYARRGGVIKKYQAGGWTEDAQGNPITVPPEPPQQPASGAAGQQLPATPPPTQPVTPTPTQAIATQPIVDPLADFKDDADVENEKRAEQEVLSGGRTRTVRPSGDIIMGSPPPDRGPEMHADFDRLQTLKSMLPQIAKEDTSKGQRYLKEAQTTVDALDRRVHNETIRQNDQQRKDWQRSHANEVKAADKKRMVGIMQLGDLDQQLAGKFGELVNGPDGYQTLIDNAKTPEERRNAAMRLKASPIKQMPDNERAEAARQLMSLNDRLGPAMAAQLVVTLGTPPMRGTEGVNKMKGRAAANYELGPKDPVGNFTLITPRGTYRVDPDTYVALKVSRNKGYDSMVSSHKEYLEAKRLEGKPGWVARQTDAAIDAVRGVFK
jgi:hypothetical protein